VQLKGGMQTRGVFMGGKSGVRRGRKKELKPYPHLKKKKTRVN